MVGQKHREQPGAWGWGLEWGVGSGLIGRSPSPGESGAVSEQMASEPGWVLEYHAAVKRIAGWPVWRESPNPTCIGTGSGNTKGAPEETVSLTGGCMV